MQVSYCGSGRWLMAFQVKTGSTDSGLYMSINNGETFLPVDLPVNMDFTQQYAKSIAVNSGTGEVVICGLEVGTATSRFFWSSDYINWTEISTAGTSSDSIVPIYPLEPTP